VPINENAVWLKLTNEQYEALQRGEAITIDPQKPRQWEPVGGRFYVSYDGVVRKSDSDDKSKSFGTEYPTHALAARAADFMRPYHRLVAYALEHWPEYEVPEMPNEAAFPALSSGDGEWHIYAHRYARGPWIPYGPREKVEELVDKLNRGEVAL